MQKKNLKKNLKVTGALHQKLYKLLKSLKVSKKINSSSELAATIKFKKNKNIGSKIKNIGKKILKKTINELDAIINNETKKT